MVDPLPRHQALKHRLSDGGILLVPSVYDALSARLAARAGFEAVIVGRYSVAASRMGAPDIGLLGLSEMTDHTGRIADAVPIHVLADGDTGYGGDESVRRTIRDHAKAGASAVMIEDQTWPKRCGHMEGKGVVTREEAVARVRAAVRARDGLGLEVLILARTDARGPEGFDEAMWRMAAFADAGADILFLEAPVDEREMESFAGAFHPPTMANMLDGGVTPILAPERLSAMGFSLVVYGTSVLGAAAWSVDRALKAIRAGTFPEDVYPHGDLIQVLGFGEDG